MRASLLLAASAVPLSYGQCPNSCSRNGICNPLGICECANGFDGGDCSLRTCPTGNAFFDAPEIDDVAYLKTTCSGRGLCNHKTGDCECEESFSGIACERTKCKNNCSNRGKCMSMRQLADTTRSRDSLQFSYDIWDADKIYGCQCDEGFTGYDCSIRVCPVGDDPLTTSENNDEIQLLRCWASSSSGGQLVLYFDGKPSTAIPVASTAMELKFALQSIPSINDIKVSYTSGTTLCRNDLFDNIVYITFTHNPGPLPPLVAETYDMDPSSVVEVAASPSFGLLTDHTGTDHYSVKGNKEAEECSNRGICDQETGTCQCFDTNGDFYAGNDCSVVVTYPVSTCPGDPVCSDRGVCDVITKRCTCEDGFSGGDCSQRTCPKGLSWFSYPSSNNVAHDEMVECSNAGICSRGIGQCLCNDGFFGSACEYIGCSGEDTTQTSCNGHGRCISMRELAALSSKSYGSDPNDASTFDADRIFGCQCDDGYEGFDCSLRSCPVGVDPSNNTTDITFPCSNKGLCSHATGKCKCFTGWGSSDGSGSYGTNNDCGRRLKQLRGYP